MDAIAKEIAARIRAMPSHNTSDLRQLRREYSRQLRREPARRVVAVALALLERSNDIPRFVADELVCHHREALASLGSADLKRFSRGLNSWGTVDCFACFLAGRTWRARQIPDSLIWNWARSKDRWMRRAALVSTVPLNNNHQGGSGDARRTLATCKLLLDDRDDMVVKAMSWALRELAKREPHEVARFVEKHRAKLAPRVIREVRNKLDTGRKNPARNKSMPRRAGSLHRSKS